MLSPSWHATHPVDRERVADWSRLLSPADLVSELRAAAQMKDPGLPTNLVIYPGAPHGFFSTTSPIADAGARAIIAHVQT